LKEEGNRWTLRFRMISQAAESTCLQAAEDQGGRCHRECGRWFVWCG